MHQLITEKIAVTLGTRDEKLTTKVVECFKDVPIVCKHLKEREQLLSLSTKPSPLSNNRHQPKQANPMRGLILLDLELIEGTEKSDFESLLKGINQPIVLISNHESDELPLELVIQGAQDFIRVKDIYPTRLLMKIHLAISRFNLLQELELERNRIRRESHEKTKFIGHLSHEIRNPLNAILGVTDMLNDSNLTAAQKELVSTLVASNNQLLMVVNDVLDLAKIEKGQTPICIDSVRLNEVLNEVHNMYRLQLDAKKLRYACHFQENLPTFINTDQRRLKQILFNLVSNAIKNTDNGEIAIYISLASDLRIKFEVKDTGRGIPSDALNEIFDSFKQVKAEDSRFGTGLGLTVCYELTALLGGSIGARNNSREGSTFWFTIDPQMKQDHVLQAFNSKIMELDSKKNLHTSTPTPQRETYTDSKKCILIADDDPLNLNVISKMLSSWGLHSVSCWNGLDALEKIQEKNTFQALVLDCNMPEMTGLELTHKMRQMGIKTPIIGVSGDIGMENSCLQAGMDAFMLKPVQQKTLVTTILQLINSDAG